MDRLQQGTDTKQLDRSKSVSTLLQNWERNQRHHSDVWGRYFKKYEMMGNSEPLNRASKKAMAPARRPGRPSRKSGNKAAPTEGEAVETETLFDTSASETRCCMPTAEVVGSEGSEWLSHIDQGSLQDKCLAIQLWIDANEREYESASHNDDEVSEVPFEPHGLTKDPLTMRGSGRRISDGSVVVVEEKESHVNVDANYLKTPGNKKNSEENQIRRPDLLNVTYVIDLEPDVNTQSEISEKCRQTVNKTLINACPMGPSIGVNHESVAGGTASSTESLTLQEPTAMCENANAVVDLDIDEEPPNKETPPTTSRPKGSPKIKRHFLDKFNVAYFKELGMEWKPDVNALRKEVETYVANKERRNVPCQSSKGNENEGSPEKQASSNAVLDLVSDTNSLKVGVCTPRRDSKSFESDSTSILSFREHATDNSAKCLEYSETGCGLVERTPKDFHRLSRASTNAQSLISNLDVSSMKIVDNKMKNLCDIIARNPVPHSSVSNPSMKDWSLSSDKGSLWLSRGKRMFVSPFKANVADDSDCALQTPVIRPQQKAMSGHVYNGKPYNEVGSAAKHTPMRHPSNNNDDLDMLASSSRVTCSEIDQTDDLERPSHCSRRSNHRRKTLVRMGNDPSSPRKLQLLDSLRSRKCRMETDSIPRRRQPVPTREKLDFNRASESNSSYESMQAASIRSCSLEPKYPEAPMVVIDKAQVQSFMSRVGKVDIGYYNPGSNNPVKLAKSKEEANHLHVQPDEVGFTSSAGYNSGMVNSRIVTPCSVVVKRIPCTDEATLRDWCKETLNISSDSKEIMASFAQMHNKVQSTSHEVSVVSEMINRLPRMVSSRELASKRSGSDGGKMLRSSQASVKKVTTTYKENEVESELRSSETLSVPKVTPKYDRSGIKETEINSALKQSRRKLKWMDDQDVEIVEDVKVTPKSLQLVDRKVPSIASSFPDESKLHLRQTRRNTYLDKSYGDGTASVNPVLAAGSGNSTKVMSSQEAYSEDSGIFITNVITSDMAYSVSGRNCTGVNMTGKLSQTSDSLNKQLKTSSRCNTVIATDIISDTDSSSISNTGKDVNRDVEAIRSSCSVDDCGNYNTNSSVKLTKSKKHRKNQAGQFLQSKRALRSSLNTSNERRAKSKRASLRTAYSDDRPDAPYHPKVSTPSSNSEKPSPSLRNRRELGKLRWLYYAKDVSKISTSKTKPPRRNSKAMSCASVVVHADFETDKCTQLPLENCCDGAETIDARLDRRTRCNSVQSKHKRGEKNRDMEAVSKSHVPDKHSDIKIRRNGRDKKFASNEPVRRSKRVTNLSGDCLDIISSSTSGDILYTSDDEIFDLKLRGQERNPKTNEDLKMDAILQVSLVRCEMLAPSGNTEDIVPVSCTNSHRVSGLNLKSGDNNIDDEVGLVEDKQGNVLLGKKHPKISHLSSLHDVTTHIHEREKRKTSGKKSKSHTKPAKCSVRCNFVSGERSIQEEFEMLESSSSSNSSSAFERKKVNMLTGTSDTFMVVDSTDDDEIIINVRNNKKTKKIKSTRKPDKEVLAVDARRKRTSPVTGADHISCEPDPDPEHNPGNDAFKLEKCRRRNPRSTVHCFEDDDVEAWYKRLTADVRRWRRLPNRDSLYTTARPKIHPTVAQKVVFENRPVSLRDTKEKTVPDLKKKSSNSDGYALRSEFVIVSDSDSEHC